jgi:hypothetical protein
LVDSGIVDVISYPRAVRIELGKQMVSIPDQVSLYMFAIDIAVPDSSGFAGSVVLVELDPV